MTGNVKHEINVLDAIQPYMKVRSRKPKKGDDVDDKTEAGRRKGRKSKGKGKATQGGAEEADAESGGKEELSHIDTFDSTQRVSEDADQQGLGERGEFVLVVHKIDTVASGTRNYIVFNAVGYVLVQPQSLAHMDVYV